jgi:hypothetical protein
MIREIAKAGSDEAGRWGGPANLDECRDRWNVQRHEPPRSRWSAVLGWARPVDIEEVIDLHQRALREWADALAS